MALAASLVWLIWPADPLSPLRTPPYRLIGPLGGITHARGPQGPTQIFTPSSRLRLMVQPIDALTHEAPKLRIFAGPPNTPLVPVPSGFIQAESGGFYRLKATGQTLFGARYGPQVVHIALTTMPEVFPSLAGKQPDVARALHPSVRWLRVQIDYRIEHNGGED